MTNLHRGVIFLYNPKKRCYNVVMQERVMAFDVGDRRIGVAVSDPFNSYAMPLETYFRTKDPREDVKNLLLLVSREGAGRIVLGLPLNADGTRSVQTDKTEKFLALLKESTSLPVETEDERYTTLEARRDLVGMGISAKGDKKRKAVDSLAAAYILESYLARRQKEMNMKEERNENAEELEDNRVELIDEDGVKHEYEHLLTFEYQKEWYVALTPALPAEEDPEEDDEGDEVAIYHLVGGEDDEQLETIEDEDLLDELFEEFCRIYDDEDDADEETDN